MKFSKARVLDAADTMAHNFLAYLSGAGYRAVVDGKVPASEIASTFRRGVQKRIREQVKIRKDIQERIKQRRAAERKVRRDDC